MALLFFALLLSTSALSETLEVVRTIPHTGYSEGLDYHEGFLWHALPKEILKISPKDGSVVDRFKPATEYSESLQWVKGRLWNVSFSDNGIYVADLKAKSLSFARKGSVPEKHAWGITYDGKHLVVTGDYSDKLYFLNPKTMKLERTITTPVRELEDLAWDGKGLWTSSFGSHQGKIFRVDPKTGAITKFFSLPQPEECPIIDGTAWDGQHLWVTGKNCISIYQVKKPPESALGTN